MDTASRSILTVGAECARMDQVSARLLLENVEDYAVVVLTAERRVSSWNRGATLLFGYDASEMLDAPLERLFTADDVAAGKACRDCDEAQVQGRAETEGWRVRRDGKLVWIRVLTVALKDQEELRGFGLMMRESGRALGGSADVAGTPLVDAVVDYAIFRLDEIGRVATWNEGARRLKGYESEAIIGRRFDVFYPPEDRERDRPSQVLETVRREGRFEDEGWRVRSDGSRFWASVVITPLRAADGTVTGFAKVTRDLTERRHVVEELRRSEERFRLLVEGVSDYAIYMLDPEGHVTTWNRGAERLKGYPAHAIVGRHFSVFFRSEDVAAGIPLTELAQARATGHVVSEGWRLRQDGSQFWASVAVTPLYDSSGVHLGFAKVTRDMTAQREAIARESELVREQAAREKAEEANRVKDEFLAMVSHELRTPLNAILGWARVLRSRVHNDSLLTKAVDVIVRNVEAQGHIIEDLLDMSRVTTGKLQLELKPVDLVETAKRAMDAVYPSVTAKRITLTLRTTVPTLFLLGDGERLQQVAWNLLANAIKFTGDGGTIIVFVGLEAGKAMVAVSDTGRGIDPEFLPHVFERFRQADARSARRTGGLGLGLALVQHLVALHGGNVVAESAGLGKGATFRVTLPVGMDAPSSRGEHVERKPLAALQLLVIEDEPIGREMLQLLLQDAGAEVEVAGSVEEGIALFGRARPDAVISDIGMPNEDGYDFLRRMRTLESDRERKTPVLALTAFAREQDRARALEAGFITFLTKPVDPEKLFRAIQTALQK